MKKMYNQPIVETTNFIVSGQALCTSPTNNLNVNQQDPIPTDGGGD